MDELVVLGRAESRVEVLDDDDLDAGLAEHPEPLGRVEEERRRGADENLVRVRIERDDGRPSAALAGLLEEPAEQVPMTEWIRRTRRRRRTTGRAPRARPSTPATTSIAPSAIRRPRRRERVDQDLVRCQPAVRHVAMATSRPLPSRTRIGAPLARGMAARMNVPSARSP